jgi:hypothetical protein
MLVIKSIFRRLDGTCRFSDSWSAVGEEDAGGGAAVIEEAEIETGAFFVAE